MRLNAHTTHFFSPDDLFAFVIKMPIMHRLACLRDDVIFFIYLYQRFKYRTDYTRVNEYGQCVAPTEEMLKQVNSHEEKDAVNSDQNQTAMSVEDKDSVKSQPRRRGARDK